MTKQKLKLAAVAYLVKTFKGGKSEAHVVQAAVAVVLTK